MDPNATTLLGTDNVARVYAKTAAGRNTIKIVKLVEGQSVEYFNDGDGRLYVRLVGGLEMHPSGTVLESLAEGDSVTLTRGEGKVVYVTQSIGNWTSPDAVLQNHVANIVNGQGGGGGITHPDDDVETVTGPTNAINVADPRNPVILVIDEVVTQGTPLSGAVPADAKIGVDTSTGQMYYDNGTAWTPVPVASVDLHVEVKDETGGNGAGTTTPPNPGTATPDVGDIEIAIYDDVVIYFTANAANWTAPTRVEIPRDQINFADAILKSDDATGDGGTATTAARSDHKHAAQSPSATANNLIETDTTDGLHFLPLDASGFDGNLETTDDTLQKIADRFDDYDPEKDRVFASETAVGPAAAGSPTVAEVKAWNDGLAEPNTATLVYYTGTDTDGDDPTYVYDIDKSGNVTLLEQPSGTDMNLLGDNLTQAAARTHSFADFGQTWNNLGSWTINQALAAFPGNFGTAVINSAAWVWNLAGAPGVANTVRMDADQATFEIHAGTEVRELMADTASVRLHSSTSTDGSKGSTVAAANQGVQLGFGATADLQVDGDAGTDGQVIASQGPNLPPEWVCLLYTSDAADE